MIDVAKLPPGIGWATENKWPTEDDLRRTLVERAKAYADRVSKTLAWVSRAACGADRDFILRVERGQAWDPKKYDAAMRWFEENEPADEVTQAAE